MLGFRIGCAYLYSAIQKGSMCIRRVLGFRVGYVHLYKCCTNKVKYAYDAYLGLDFSYKYMYLPNAVLKGLHMRTAHACDGMKHVLGNLFITDGDPELSYYPILF